MSGQLKTTSYVKLRKSERKTEKKTIFQMGLLKFGLLCIDFLAWPMLALAYPLCASIRAIETGSKYHMRKLVTYWTVLSIVSLFEHTLRVMEWVPFWPYIKLVGTFWLVIPRFNGACYAYDCLVSAEFGQKLQCILSQFSNAFHAHKHLSEDIKAMGQTTEQEETEERKSIDIKAMEQTTEQGTEEKKFKSAVDNIGQMQRKETEATWVNGIPVPHVAEEKIIPEIDSSKLYQREWTCAVCQVTTTSESDLKSHVGGKRHRAKCAELKSIKNAATEGESKKKGKQEKNVQANAPAIKEIRQVKEKADSRLYCGICNIWCSDEAAMASHLKGRKHASKLQQMAILRANASDQKERQVKESNNASSVSTDSTLYCRLCNVRPPGEAAMVSHLKGRKHLSKLKQMGILMQ